MVVIVFFPLKYTKVKQRHVPLSGPKGFNIAQYTKSIATALLSQMTHNVSFLQSPLPISSSPDIFSRCSLMTWKRSEKVRRNLSFHLNMGKTYFDEYMKEHDGAGMTCKMDDVWIDWRCTSSHLVDHKPLLKLGHLLHQSEKTESFKNNCKYTVYPK